MPTSSLLRPRDGEHAARVTNIELFFDLVFVFAITQLSSTLRHHFNIEGVLTTAVLFLAVWYVWISTSWVTNWLDPGRWPVRMFLLAATLVGLVMSAALPQAFGEGGLVFASAYIAMQVGRSLFMLWALGQSSPANTRNFQRITVWLGVAGLLWVAGGLSASWRLPLWILAAVLDYAGPALGFRVPRLGASTTRDWDVAGGHLAERCGLFVIIALGESVLVTGATASELAVSLPRGLAFVLAFAGTSAFWWIYFDTGADAASAAISDSANPGHLARLAYTYIHLLIVAGIIVGAAGNEVLLAHPVDAGGVPAGAALLGGPGLFLGGTLLFKWATRGRPPLSHLAGLALLAVFTILDGRAGPYPDLALAAGTAAILMITAGWESWSLRRTAPYQDRANFKEPRP